MSALSSKQPEAAAVLIKKKAPIDTESSIWRDNPLDIASHSGFVEIARTLIKRGANIHHVGFLNRTALHWAALSGNSDLIIELLRYGIDPYTKDIFGYTAKDFAVQQKHTEAASALTWWPSLYRPTQAMHFPETAQGIQVCLCLGGACGYHKRRRYARTFHLSNFQGMS